MNERRCQNGRPAHPTPDFAGAGILICLRKLFYIIALQVSWNAKICAGTAFAFLREPVQSLAGIQQSQGDVERSAALRVRCRRDNTNAKVKGAADGFW